mgnify:CR=1 FL=1
MDFLEVSLVIPNMTKAQRISTNKEINRQDQVHWAKNYLRKNLSLTLKSLSFKAFILIHIFLFYFLIPDVAERFEFNLNGIRPLIKLNASAIEASI